MAFVTDPFDSMPLGPGVPPGWTINGSGVVEPFSAGGIWSPHQWYNYGGLGLTTPFFGPTRSFTAFFGFQEISLFPQTTFFKLFSNDLSTPPQKVQLLRVDKEIDCSISVYVTGLSVGNTILVANSGSLMSYGFQNSHWFYAQFNLTLTTILIGFTWYFVYNVSMLVDSNLILSGSATGLPDPQFLDGGLPFSGVEFAQFLGGNLGISQVEMLTLQGNNVFPNPGRNPFERISQIPIEISSLVSSGHVRVSQFPAEVIEGKTSAKIRISQIPIELMRKATTQQGGWIVSES